MTRPLHKHHALKVGAVVLLILAVDLATDVLPYLGFCSVRYEDGYIDLLSLLYILVLLGLFGWTGADIWTWVKRTPDRDHWAGAPIAAVALLIGMSGGSRLVSHAQTSVIEQLAKDMRPTVVAVNAYTSQNGAPPATITAVAEPPPVSICAARGLVYEVDVARTNPRRVEFQRGMGPVPI